MTTKRPIKNYQRTNHEIAFLMLKKWNINPFKTKGKWNKANMYFFFIMDIKDSNANNDIKKYLTKKNKKVV